MILQPGALLVLCISSATGTDMCEMSATRISCASIGMSSLLTQCSLENEKESQFGIVIDAMRQSIPHVRSQQCRKQLHTFTDALMNSSLWAVQMLEASGNFVEVDGYHLGEFDECIDLSVKGDGDNIRGKYCLADVSECGRFGRMGICVPNDCDYREVQIFMEWYLSEARKASVGVTVSEESCVTKGSARRRRGSALFTYGVVGLVFWSVFVTVTELISTKWEGSSEIWRMIVGVFSYNRSIRQLASTNAEDGFSGIHFMRVATIFALIMYQRHQLMIEGPVRNRSYLQKLSWSPWPIFDALIFLTGFLAVVRLQKESMTNTKWRCFLLCLAKWLRMAPLYAASIAFYAVAFEDIGNGPLWAERIGRESRRCGHFWWANLSLVNNYISAAGQCIAQSWYLAVTSHGFVVTLIFMHLKTGKAFVGLSSLAVSLTTSLVLFLWNDYALHGHEGPIAFSRLFIKTHYRLPSFLLGASSALLYHHIRRNKDKTTWVHFLTPFILTILGLILVLCMKLDIQSQVLFPLVSSLTWSAFLGCVIILFPLYNIGVSDDTFLKTVFIPLSRLSYPALLSHNVVQLYQIGSMRTSEYVTFSGLVRMGAGDIFASYIFAILLYIILDGPVISAIKIIFWTKEKKISGTTEENK